MMQRRLRRHSINVAAAAIKAANKFAAKKQYFIYSRRKIYTKAGAAINSRGSRVLFVAMPTSGMIREIDEKRYPRANFLDVFEKEVGVTVLSSADEPVPRWLTSRFS